MRAALQITIVVAAISAPSIFGAHAVASEGGAPQGPSGEPQIALVHSNATVVEISTAAFSASPQEASIRLLATVRYKRAIDGRSVSREDLARPVGDTVARLGCIVIPRIEFRQVDVKDVLRFISTAQTTPEPDKTQSIGLIHEQPKSGGTTGDQADALMERLSLNATSVTCSLERVNFLEFIEHVSKAMKLDVGFSHDGRVIFGRDGKWASSDEPAYLMQFSE